jgi:hypothetical protein
LCSLGYITKSYAFALEKGNCISFEVLSYVRIALHASNLLFAITVTSSAHVETIGYSSLFDPHVSIPYVNLSATKRNRYGLVIPPYSTPLFIFISLVSFHIFNLGVFTMNSSK